MPIPRGGLARFRTSLVPVRGHGDGTDAVYARALLERTEITERYYVEQEISKNRSIALSGNPRAEQDDEPPGRIEMSIPFDGNDYFTQQAYEDVTRRLAHLERRRRMATIGHLLLRDDEKTSLRTSLNLNDRYGTVPIRIPVTQADGSPAPLTADRKACRIRYDYEPEPPGIVPIELKIMLYDPDSLDLPTVDLMNGRGQRYVDDVIKRIRQQVSFKSELLLRVVVRLLLPVKKGYPKLKPFVARVSVGWPTVTSLQTLSLHFGEGPTAVTPDGLKDAPVRYNPVKRCLEWEQVPMAWVKTNPADGDEGIRSYRSADMLLSIRHPGELYEQPSLEIHAEAEVPGYLLSGLEARLYDATGRPQKLQPMLTTRVSSEVRLVLDDAFARRDFSPFQHLVFDEIIPDDMRIADIITALNDAGFTVSRVRPEHQGHEVDAETGSLNWFLAARRREGPDDMNLWIFVEGRRHRTKRETVVHGGGVTHRTTLDSGELKVFIRGTLAGDHKELAREMNALQQALRERYDRVRSRR